MHVNNIYIHTATNRHARTHAHVHAHTHIHAFQESDLQKPGKHQPKTGTHLVQKTAPKIYTCKEYSTYSYASIAIQV